MEKDVAEQILKIAMDCSGELNSSIALVQASCDPVEAAAHRNVIARVLGEIFVEVILRSTESTLSSSLRS
jgi:hypothetical protein